MKINWNRRDTTRSAYLLIVAVLAISFYSYLANFKAVNAWLSGLLQPIAPIFGGLVIAYLLSPVMERIELTSERAFTRYADMRPKRRRFLSLLATYLLALVVVVSFLLIVLPKAASSAAQMAMQIKTYVAAAEEGVTLLIEHIPEELITEELAAELQSFAGNAVSKMISLLNTSLPVLFNSLMHVGNSVINFFVAIIVSVYVLAEKEGFAARSKKVVYAVFPRPAAESFLDLVRTGDQMFGRFITGKIIDSLIIGLLCFAGVSIMQMPNAVLVSFIVGVTNVIPYFGPFIGAIPAFFLIAIVSPMQGLLFLVFVLLLQQIDGNIIGPKILGNSTGLSAFWVMFSILFFGGALGFTGMIIGVPLFGLIYWWTKIAVADRLAKKGLPTATESYRAPGGPTDIPSDEPSSQN